MKLDLTSRQQDSAEQFVYSLADDYFAYLENHGEDAMQQLTDEQNTLMAYVYLDSQVQEGGFLQLIADGYGEYVFMNPLADSLRRWRIKLTPKIIDKAKTLYQQHGAEIEALAESQTNLDVIRARFDVFEELDADYYDAVEDDMETAAAYIQANSDKFINLP